MLCTGRGLSCGKTRVGCCTTTTHQLTRHSICNFLAKHKTTVLPQPPYSPDLAPTAFFLFPMLKATLKGHRFQTMDKIEENIIQQLCTIPKNAFQETS